MTQPANNEVYHPRIGDLVRLQHDSSYYNGYEYPYSRAVTGVIVEEYFKNEIPPGPDVYIVSWISEDGTIFKTTEWITEIVVISKGKI